MATAISMKLFLAIVGVLIATQFLDYWLGTERAQAEGLYDDQRGRSGRVAKLGGLLLLLVVRLMESAVAMAVPVLDSHGAIATAAAIALWRAEAQSAENHILALGGNGIPVLSQLLAAFRAVEQFIMPKIPSPSPPPAPRVRPGGES